MIKKNKLKIANLIKSNELDISIKPSLELGAQSPIVSNN